MSLILYVGKASGHVVGSVSFPRHEKPASLSLRSSGQSAAPLHLASSPVPLGVSLTWEQRAGPRVRLEGLPEISWR